MLYIILAILMFGLLIAVHEFGHFASAKLFGIQVNEFSIGMGPALWKKTKRRNALQSACSANRRILCDGGEDEKSSNPRAFGNAAAWKQLVVLAGGAAMNFFTGLLILLILYAPVQGFRIPVYSGAEPGYGAEDCGLQPGTAFCQWMATGSWCTGTCPLFESCGGGGAGGCGGPAGSVRPGGDREYHVSGGGTSRPQPLTRPAALLDLAALIAVNLAVMNLLPLPALDGGRIFPAAEWGAVCHVPEEDPGEV